jgi:hypothetical protein
MLCYFVGGIVILGNTPGVCLFAPPPQPQPAKPQDEKPIDDRLLTIDF